VEEHRAFQRAIGPKELHWVDGASHNDLYDKPEYVDAAVETLASFFTAALDAPLVEATAAAA
jgi:uncharacterized protein